MDKFNDFIGGHLNIDITKNCTLECPRCMRRKVSSVNFDNISMVNFKKVLKHFHSITFCGNQSDPIFHPQFIEFLKLCANKTIFIDTAASHKPMNWYIDAFKANPNAKWRFGIDGLPKDSNKYRINQDGEYLFEVMKKAREMDMIVYWQYIIFKYNENDIDEAREIAKKYGMIFETLKSSRWKKTVFDPYKPSEEFVAAKHHLGQVTTTFKPKCFYKKALFLNAQGYMSPCCWTDPIYKKTSRYEGGHEGISDLFKEKLNIKNVSSIAEILLSDEWIHLFNKLNEERDIPEVCARHCTKGPDKIWDEPGLGGRKLNYGVPANG